MQITKISMISGKERTMDLDVTEEQMNSYTQGLYLQDAFPHLSPADREFIKTGTTSDEWDSIFDGIDDMDGMEDDDDYDYE